MTQFLLYDIWGNIVFYAPAFALSTYVAYKIANGLSKNVLDSRYRYIVTIILTVSFLGILKTTGVLENPNASNTASLITIIFYALVLSVLGSIWRHKQKQANKDNNKV